MKYRTWDQNTKARIVLEGPNKTIPPAELCNKYRINQSPHYRWTEEFHANMAKAFE